MGEQAAASVALRKLRVFLSYSRKDAEFVARLASALTDRGFLADFDRSTHDKDNVETGIAAEDDWWQRLQEMILAADVMVFLVSPDSATSRVCDEEIAYARVMGKRVIAILRRPIDFAAAPPRLAALNVKIDATADDDESFAACVAVLSAALDRDVSWLREQTRLQQAAADWSASGEREDELLHGAEIAEADAWLARKPPNVGELSELLVAYLDASRLGQAQRDERERQTLVRQRRLQTWIGAVTAIALVITLAGAAYVVDRQRNVARSQSLTLARSVEAYLDRQDFAGALRLAVLSARDTFLSPASDEARIALASAAAASPLVAQFVGHEGRVNGTAFSPSEEQIVSWGQDGSVRVWDVATGAQVLRYETGAPVWGARFFADGARLVSWGEGGVHVFGLNGENPGVAPMQFDATVYNVGLTPDEELLFVAVGSGAPEDRGKRQLVVRRVSDGAPHAAPIAYDEILGNFSFTPDGQRALVWSRGFAQMYDVATMRPIGEPMRHAGVMGGAVLSADATRVLTYSNALGGASDNTARLWDAATGREIGAPFQHAASLLDAVFTPDGRYVVTEGKDAIARVWSADTGAPVTPPLSHQGPISADTPDDPWVIVNRGVYDVDVSPDGNVLATSGSDRRVRLWRIDQGGAPVGVISLPAWSHRVRFSADGSRLVTLDVGGAVREWDLVTGLEQGAPMPADATFGRLNLSNDRARGVTWSDSGLVSVWNLGANRARSPNMGHGAIVAQAHWVGENEILAGSYDGRVRFWNAATGAEAGPAITHNNLLDATVSPDGARVLSWGGDGMARQWDRRTHAPVSAQINAGTLITRATYVGGGQRIATVDVGQVFRLWNAETGAQIGAGVRPPTTIGVNYMFNPSILLSYDPLAMHSMEVSPDGRRILGWANADGAIVMDADTGAQIGSPMAHGNVVTGAAYSHSGAVIATWSGLTQTAEVDNSLRLWNADTTPIGAPLTSEAAVRGAAFSSDDRYVVAWTNDGNVMLREVASDAAPLTITHVEQRPGGATGFVVGAAFMPDGAQIVSWGYDGVKFWDRSTGQQVGRALAHNGPVTHAELSPDGRYILTLEMTNTASAKIRIWDVATHLLINEQGQGVGVLNGGQWAPDGQTVLTWGEALAPQIWPQPWMAHADNLNDWARDLCNANLRGDAVERPTVDGVSWTGVRRISAADASLAPILRGREGEDVCAWEPKWYDRILDFLFGWMK